MEIGGRKAVQFWGSIGGDAMLQQSTYDVAPDGTLENGRQEMK